MATHTFHIDGSSDKAKEVLQYLRSLDFVKEEQDDFVLTEEHLAITQQRRKDRMSGKSQTYAWDEVKDSLGKRQAG